MTWCSLRHVRWPLTDLRRLDKREDVVDVYLFSRDHYFVNQTLGHRLGFFKREALQMPPQELPKGLGMVDHLLPMHRLLLRTAQLLLFLLDLLPLGRDFSPPTLQFLEVDHVGLIRIEQALALSLEPLLPLVKVLLLGGKGGEILLFGVGPGLMEVGYQLWLLQQVTERLPDHRVKPVSPDAP